MLQPPPIAVADDVPSAPETTGEAPASSPGISTSGSVPARETPAAPTAQPPIVETPIAYGLPKPQKKRPLWRTLGLVVHQVLAQLGFELRRLPRGYVWGQDAFSDQVRLLRGAPVATVFDVGANAGQTTHVYRGLFPEATIHAFEPSPDAFRALRENYRDCGHIVPHCLAVADRTARLDFHRNQCDLTDSLLPPDPRSQSYLEKGVLEPRETVQVDAVRLDDFCRERGISSIDVLKIDVQGAEGQVLRGAESLLRTGRVRLVYTEVQFAPLYCQQASFAQVHGILTDARYRLFGLYNLVQGGGNGLIWADALYLFSDASTSLDGRP